VVFSNIRLDVFRVERVEAAKVELAGNELPLLCRGIGAIKSFLDLARFLAGGD